MSTVIFELPKDTFVPGEEINGTVLWDLDKRPKKSPELYFGWWTEGIGTSDSEIIRSWKLSADQTGKFTFSVKAPLAPHSYEGEIVSIVWGVVFHTGKKRDSTRTEVVIKAPQPSL